MEVASLLVGAGGGCGFAFAALMLHLISRVEVDPAKMKKAAKPTPTTKLKDAEAQSSTPQDRHEKMFKIYGFIRDGAKAFLHAEYLVCSGFVAIFGLLVMCLTAQTGTVTNWRVGMFTATSFVVGAATSMVSGYLGMMVAVFANARTTMEAEKVLDAESYKTDQVYTAEGEKRKAAGWTAAFNLAFRAGGVMGYSLCALAMVTLFMLINIYSTWFDLLEPNTTNAKANAKLLFECIAGFGLGGSCIALFGRVGGGIYTKAADVGADLAGKVLHDLPEDSPRNPATIADNVGDNVGDVAGMGSDLFGSFAEATCAALVISASSDQLVAAGWGALMFPLLISASGIMVCMLTSFLATDFFPVKKAEDIETVLKVQLAVTTALMVAVMFPLASAFLPASFAIGSAAVTPARAAICVCGGLIGGCIIGFVTEYYTSHSYTPVRDVAQSCETGAATNIIYGLALGYLSCVVPISIIAINVYAAFSLANMYGVALAALGMLGTLSTCLSIDVYGPICDNAGGVAEMSEFNEKVREVTDELDAAGNTTAAIGKGFAIGSAALVSLALFGGFVTRVSENPNITVATGTLDINVLKPITFAFLFVGAMLPYWFTAMTMKSVGVAANEMVKEVKRQFDENEKAGTPMHDMDKEPKVEHEKCIKISTDASLREMILPGLLVILAPILIGSIFGVEAVCGSLVGSLTSGVQLAISQSNTGGAWDNAKKYVEKGQVYVPAMVPDPNNAGNFVPNTNEQDRQAKNSDVHKAAVTGDTVGDPLKDTSGPALNILMKLQAIIALVFADFFVSISCGRGLLDIPSDTMVCAAGAVH
eukprot:SAG31_NODE_712_length_12660_cov_9.298463_4_plen_819_part_00